MLNIQEVTDAINRYRHNKGFIKKLTRTDHPAIIATEAYLNSLPAHNNLLSNQDLFCINRFFLLDHPVKLGHAAYKAWFAITYKNFCTLNYLKATRFLEGNAGEMWGFFQVLSQAYQENSLTEESFFAYSRFCVEEMLNPAYVNAIKQSVQAKVLAKSLIKLKRSGTLTPENQSFIMAYSGTFIISVTTMLIALDKAGINTLPNRAIIANFAFPLPLQCTIHLLEKLELLTQENFDLISAENNLSWLIALEAMPEALITSETWQGLINLSKTSHENDFSQDIKEYAEQLKNNLSLEHVEPASLASERKAKIQAARAAFFEVPTNLIALAEDNMATPKVSVIL